MKEDNDYDKLDEMVTRGGTIIRKRKSYVNDYCDKCRRISRIGSLRFYRNRQLCYQCYRGEMTFMGFPKIFDEPLTKHTTFTIQLTESQWELLEKRIAYIFPNTNKNKSDYLRRLVLSDLEAWKDELGFSDEEEIDLGEKELVKAKDIISEIQELESKRREKHKKELIKDLEEGRELIEEDKKDKKSNDNPEDTSKNINNNDIIINSENFDEVSQAIQEYLKELPK